MAQTVNVGGVTHTFPDDATPEMIAEALGADYEAPAKAPEATLKPGGMWSHAQQVASGLVEGFGPEVSAATQSAKARIGNLLTNGSLADPNVDSPYGSTYQQTLDAYKARQGEFEQANPRASMIETIAGNTPTTLAGIATGGGAANVAGNALTKVAPSIGPAIAATGDFLGGNAGEGKGIANWLLRRGSQATSGAIQGGEAGALQSHEGEGSVGDQALTGAEIGGPLNTVATPALTRLLAPFRAEIPQESADIGNAASKLGVEIRGGQLTPNASINKLDSSLASGGNEEQIASFNKALPTTIGESAENLAPTVMKRAMTRIGGVFDKAAQNGEVDTTSVDPKTGLPVFAQKMQELRNEMLAEMPSDDPATKRITDAFDRVNQVELSNHGNIPGNEYLALTRQGSTTGRLLRDSDPNVKYWGGQLRDVLDDGLARGTPQYARELGEARQQFRNYRVLEPLVDKSPSGVIDPKALLAPVARQTRDFAQGSGGDLATLARAGKFLPSATVQGGAKEVGNHLVNLANKHPIATMAAPFAMAEGLHFLPEAASLIGEHPAAAIGTGIAGTTALAARKGLGYIMQKPGYRNLLIQNGLTPPGVPVNPLLPGAAWVANQPDR